MKKKEYIYIVFILIIIFLSILVISLVYLQQNTCKSFCPLVHNDNEINYNIIEGSIYMLQAIVNTLRYLLHLLLQIIYNIIVKREWDISKDYTGFRTLGHLHNRKHNYIMTDIKMIVIVLHGLTSHPIACYNIIQEMRDRLPPIYNNSILFYTPKIFHGGDDRLEIVIDHLRDSVQPSYDDEIPIVVIGTSNGGRLAVALRPMLGKNRKVFIVSVGGPLLGSMGATWFKNYAPKMWSMLRSPFLLDELEWMGKYSIDLLEKTKEYDTQWLLIAAMNDHLILPYQSSLPKLTNATYKTYTDIGHFGIQYYAAQDIVNTLCIWFKQIDIFCI